VSYLCILDFILDIFLYVNVHITIACNLLQTMNRETQQ